MPKRPSTLSFRPARAAVGAWLAATCALGGAQAQILSCSSDGQAAPAAILERFMDADCSACWSDPRAARPPKGAAPLDWVLPSAKGDDAAMATVALPEAQERLQALGLHMTEPTPTKLTRRVPTKGLSLRVAQGFPLGGYLGVSLSLRHSTPPAQPYTAWLALVEQVPAGTEGAGVARQLVRAVAQIQPGTPPSPARPYTETRAMRVPEGARPERLRVLGWVQDSEGRLLAAAQSHCLPETKPRLPSR